MRVQVRLHDLASARCVQFLVKMLVVVSMSMNQSPSSVESCSSNVGISCSRGHGDVCLSLCGAQGVCVCLHSCVYWLFFRLGIWMWLECHSEVLAVYL